MVIKRNLLVLLACLLLSVASARETVNFGLRLGVMTPIISSFGGLGLGLRAGVPLTEELEMRAALDTAQLSSVISGDLLYSQLYAGNTRWYVGGGPEYSSHGYFGEPVAGGFGVHLTAGLVTIDTAGFFFEVQPAYMFVPSTVWFRFATGISVHL